MALEVQLTKEIYRIDALLTPSDAAINAFFQHSAAQKYAVVSHAKYARELNAKKDTQGLVKVSGALYEKVISSGQLPSAVYSACGAAPL